MSWKATAFVKEIIKGVTRTEKLVLFALADYHHTKLQACWPSLIELSEVTLMSERNLYRVLNNLERKRFVSRISRRGLKNCYLIIGLDTPDTMSPLTDKVIPTPDNTPDNTPDKSSSVIRKEPVIEPVLERGEVPKDFTADSLARGLCEAINLPITRQNVMSASASLVACSKWLPGSLAEAFHCIENAANKAQGVDRWWLDDARWKGERKNSQVSGSEQRVRAARGNIVDALREHVSDRTGRDGGERQDCAAEGVSQGIHARILKGRTASDSLGVPDLAEDF